MHCPGIAPKARASRAVGIPPLRPKIKRPEHRSGLLPFLLISAYFTVSATHTAPEQSELVEVACCTLVPFDEYAETTTE